MGLRRTIGRWGVRVRRWLWRIPPPGRVDFGELRRLAPLSRDFGTDRGQALDRYYIERFLEAHAADVQGRVLEVGDRSYTQRFGAGRVTHSDVLHVSAGNPQATIVADLAAAPQIADATFDCVILTQTLLLIYDPRAAIRTLHRILRPGGVLLVTVPGITPVPHETTWGNTWYWSFSVLALRRLLAEAFGEQQVTVAADGNVLAATAFLHGLAVEELTTDELDHCDPDYPVIVRGRAVRER